MLHESPIVDAVRQRRVDTGRANRSLPEQLRRLGLRPRLMQCAHGVMAGGAALQLSLDEMAASPELTANVLARLRRLLLDRVPVTLTIAGLGRCGQPFAALERVCTRLCALLSSPCIDRQRLGIAVHASDLSLPAFRLVSHVLLGPGNRFLILDAGQMQPERDASPGSHAASIWSGLYLQRNRLQRVLPVYGGGVRSRCPLLGDETSGGLLPQRSILVPPDSAWLPLDLYLQRFADARGFVRQHQLQDALMRGLAIADRLFDRLCWPDRVQEADAFLNRRIAVVVHGIGDLVQLRRANPGNLECLREWDRLLSRMHEWLWERSRELAAERGLLPALTCRNPALQWSDGGHRRDWQRRWRQALKTDAVRHRNLLVMSPYGILPASGTGQPAHADLLPLLVHADACNFAGTVSFRHWSIHEFKNFHRLACATMQRRNAAAFVAAGT